MPLPKTQKADARPATAPKPPLAEHAFSGSLLALIVIGTLGGLLLIYGVVRPLALLASPMPIDTGQPVSSMLGKTAGGIRGFLGVSSAALILYVAAYLVSLRCSTRQAVPIILGFSLVYSVLLLFAYPGGSRDIFTNIVDGRMRWLDGFNPMVSAPRAVSSDPLFSAMTFWQDEPSYYGPFWYLLLLIPTRLVGSSLIPNLIAFRAITIPFLLGAGYMAARITERWQPRLAAAAVVFVTWSPLLLWETAVNGHNDIVMAFFMLAALSRAQHKDWATALPLLAVSILTKYVSVMLLPLFIVAAWRGEGTRCLRRVALGGALAILIGVAVFAPFWDGPITFAALAENGARRFFSSPAALLAAFIRADPATEPLNPTSRSVQIQLATLAIFAAAYVMILWRLWRGATDLLAASFYSLFFYLIIACWWFWPWYVVWPAALGGAMAGRRPAMLALVFAASALFGYVVLAWSDVLLSQETAVALPAALITTMLLPPFILWVAGLSVPTWMMPSPSEQPAAEP